MWLHDGVHVAGPYSGRGPHDDGRFFTAQAVIEGGSIRLRSKSVGAPTKVRYAWSNVPDANLVNSAGLPAAPFRSP